MAVKNPWGKGSNYFDKWFNNKWVQNSWEGNSKENVLNSAVAMPFFQEEESAPPNYILTWLEKIGYKMFKDFSGTYGYTDIGALLAIGQANKEKGWGERDANKSAWTSHNWWNVAPRESRNEVACANSRWTCFADLDEAISHYNDWMTSTPDLIAYNNPNFNPSFPDFGVLLKSEIVPTADQITVSLRLDDDFPFCTGDPTYGKEVLELQARASRDIVYFLTEKVDATKIKRDNLGIQITRAVSDAHKPMTDQERKDINLLHSQWTSLNSELDVLTNDLSRAIVARTILN